MVKIGVVLGSKESTFAKDPHYSIEIRYFEALEKAGAIAIPVTYSNIDKQLDELDGVLLPGGDFYTPSIYYTEEQNNPYVDTGIWFEGFVGAGSYALANNIPLLGICGGMQVLAILLGGKLAMGVDDHRFEDNKELAHSIEIEKDSILYNIFKQDKVMTNSIHREQVAEVNKNIKVTAAAEDGVIEAIESTKHDFAVGLQWHPECLVADGNEQQLSIFKHFVDICKK